MKEYMQWRTESDKIGMEFVYKFLIGVAIIAIIALILMAITGNLAPRTCVSDDILLALIKGGI